MAGKSILFNAEMTRAILDGKKTVTRIVLKPQRGFLDYSTNPQNNHLVFENRKEIDGDKNSYIKVPYQAGDILWVSGTLCPVVLKVTNVEVKRLNDVTEQDILSEGFESRKDFISLWNSTTKKQELDTYGWNSNPWVWVIEFERVTQGL